MSCEINERSHTEIFKVSLRESHARLTPIGGISAKKPELA